MARACSPRSISARGGTLAPRSEHATSWSTPVVVRIGDRDELVYNGANRIAGYEPETGKELWRVAGTSPEAIPTVVVGGGLLFSASGRNGPTMGIRPSRSGDITETNVVWRNLRGGAAPCPRPSITSAACTRERYGDRDVHRRGRRPHGVAAPIAGPFFDVAGHRRRPHPRDERRGTFDDPSGRRHVSKCLPKTTWKSPFWRRRLSWAAGCIFARRPASARWVGRGK